MLLTYTKGDSGCAYFCPVRPGTGTAERQGTFARHVSEHRRDNHFGCREAVCELNRSKALMPYPRVWRVL